MKYFINSNEESYMNPNEERVDDKISSSDLISYEASKKAHKEKQKEGKVMRSVKAIYKRKSYIEKLKADRDDLENNCLVGSYRF